MSNFKNGRIRTDIGIWRVSTVKVGDVYETGVKHVNEARHKGYYRVTLHRTPFQAKCDHAMVVGLIRTLVKKIKKFGHSKNAVPADPYVHSSNCAIYARGGALFDCDCEDR